MNDAETLLGFVRRDGRVGVRNRVAVIPTCGCANRAAERIAQQVPGAVLVDYTGGCSETDADLEVAIGAIAGTAHNPNVVGTVIVSLGCEALDARRLAARIAEGPAPLAFLVIQEEGGMRRTVERGVEAARRFAVDAGALQRVPCPVTALTIGLECGGSDATSGMAANPAMGAFSDLMVSRGAQVILAETSELLGAEHVLAERAASPEVRERLLATIAACERLLKATGESFMNKQPTPGNVRGGISTVEEKALGDVLKGGTTPLVDVLAYGQSPRAPGLSFMDTPGNDPASVTGLVAAGCQIVAFTTGRGNPMGNAIAPVIKITGNAVTYERLAEDIDLDASPILLGCETIHQVGRRIYELCLRVASGEETAAERGGHAEFAMLRQQPVY